MTDDPLTLVAGRMYYFVGDGTETLSAHAWERDAIDEANRLNRENETTEFVVYSREMTECVEGTSEHVAIVEAGLR